jgi:hypothetical protein
VWGNLFKWSIIMGRERNRLRLERNRRVSEEALPELVKISEEEQAQRESSKVVAPVEQAAPAAKKAPAKAPAKTRTRTTRKKAAESE